MAFNNFDGAEIETEEFNPGEFLVEEIESRQIKREDFTKQIGVSTNNLSLIFAGKKIKRKYKIGHDLAVGFLVEQISV